MFNPGDYVTNAADGATYRVASINGSFIHAVGPGSRHRDQLYLPQRLFFRPPPQDILKFQLEDTGLTVALVAPTAGSRPHEYMITFTNPITDDHLLVLNQLGFDIIRQGTRAVVVRESAQVGDV